MKLRSMLTLAMLLAITAVAHAGHGHDKMPLTAATKDALQAYEKGMYYVDRAQTEKARPLFEQAVELDPGFVMAWYQLGRTQGRIKDAREIGDKVIAMAETAAMSDGERLIIASMVAGRASDREAVLDNYRKLVDLYPNDERCQYDLGRMLMGRDDNEGAIAAFERSTHINPDFVPPYNLLGYAYKGTGDLESAEKAFLSAIKLDPENPNAFDSYAELMLKQGRHDESIESYEKAIALEPMFPSAHMGIASNLIHLGRHDEARERLQHVYRDAPHDGIRSGVCWALAVTYADEGRLDRALAELQRNYELSKKIEDTGAMAIDLVNMATVLVEAGRLDAAQQKIDRSWELRLGRDMPDRTRDIVAAFQLYTDAYMAIKKGDAGLARERAAAFASRVAELDAGPNMTEAVHELNGIIALETGHFEEAIAELEQADAVTADNMFRLATAYEGSGDKVMAREMYRHVVEYRGGLNLAYSLVRHKAAERLAVLQGV